MKGLSQLPRSGVRVPASLHILVVESHALVGAALSGLLCGPPLAATVEIVPDSETAIERLEVGAFDLVVCDLSVRPRDATIVTSRLAAAGRDVPVVCLSDAEEEQLLLDAATSGAAGFFTKDCPPDEFLHGLSSVLEGHYAVGRKVLPGMLARLSGANKRGFDRRPQAAGASRQSSAR